MEKTKELKDVIRDEKEVPTYDPPKIVTYTSDQILEQIGPAMACSGTTPTCPDTPS